MGWQWAGDGDLSKLLGTPFGLSLDTDDIDNFLVARIKSNLEYWSTTKLSLAGRVMIVKQVFLSSLWFFLSVWHGSVKAMHKVKALLRNYLWVGSEHSARTRVNWLDCSAKKQIGGLDLIDPHEATVSLL